jgi:hypothetical protein
VYSSKERVGEEEVGKGREKIEEKPRRKPKLKRLLPSL